MCRVWPEKREAHAPRRRGHVRSGAARPHRAELDLLRRLVEDVVGVLEEHLVELGLRVEERVDLARLHAGREVVHVAVVRLLGSIGWADRHRSGARRATGAVRAAARDN